MLHIPKFRELDSDVAIYLYYAGQDRKYLSYSRQTNRVFLDLPGLLLDDDTFDSDELIIQALHRSDAVKRYLKSPETAPRARAASTYSQSMPRLPNGKVDRSFLSDFANLKAMFVTAKPGDVIIMTPHGHYDHLLIGEFVGQWQSADFTTLPDYAEQTTPYRVVRWLAHDLSRRDFPSSVARRMQNRKAITQIDPDFYEPIFRLVYPDYVWGNTSKLDIFAPDYNSNDPTSTTEASFLIKYSIAFFAAYEKGELDKFYALDPDAAAILYFDPSAVEQIAQTFGSPGGYIARLIGRPAALAVALMLNACTSDEAVPIDQVKQQLHGETNGVTIRDSDGNPIDLGPLVDSIRSQPVERVRQEYGRAARNKLGLSLQGPVSPQVMRDRAQDQ